MKLTLPKKFREIVTKKSSISGALDILTDTFSDWLTNNKTEFFPEYTDHGIDHIQSVMDTVQEIVSDKAWELVTPEDIYVLTSSILLHDCAMHISKEGLWDLISNDLYNGVLLGFEAEEEWSVRWENFCQEVQRFDEHDYFHFFGEFREVSIPEVGCPSLEDNQKVVIGDFVRRFHACIAQVISTYGIPSKSGAIKVFDDNLNYLNQLSGLIARSHNHPLRDVVDILGDDRKREHRNTHPTYLMGILRIADYLQLKSDRTPKILFKTIGFCSPISIKEWTKHLSVISTNNFHPDDELLYIEAYPEDANTLVGITKLLKGLQKELDEYWAVSGEVYSRYEPLNNLTLNYRRVRSNIDHPIKYVESNHKPYHPEVLSVKADNQKLFPLLIKPLYGDLPQVGIRELLQNALDATNERYSREISAAVNTESIPYEINIDINFDENKLIINDKGVGMNVEIIKDYFLKIGSSYRTSEQWKSQFCEGGSTHIPRTGKFGIGMLAGFLIGDKIEVSTKHIADDAKAISFYYKLDSNEIELKFIRKREPGTTITIHSSKDRLQTIFESLGDMQNRRGRWFNRNEVKLSSWWYYFDTPAVSVTVIKDGARQFLCSPYKIEKERLTKDWNSIADSNLDGYYWRHNAKKPNVYCNGIVIQKMQSPEVSIEEGFSYISFNTLEICLFDNSGKFPLNLTRDELVVSEFYEQEKLYSSVKSNHIKTLKKITLEYSYCKDSIIEMLRHYCTESGSITFIPLLFDHRGVIPFGGMEHRAKQNSEKYVFVDFIYSNQRRGLVYHKKFDQLKSQFSYSCFEHAEKTPDTVERAINLLLLSRKHTQSWRFESEDVANTNLEFQAWIYIKKYDFDKFRESTTKFLESRNLTVSHLDEWVVVSKSSDAGSAPKLGEQITGLEGAGIFIFALYKAIHLEQTEFSELWEKN